MVTIYTTQTCAFCHMAKEYFEGRGVEFTEKDVTSDAELQKEMIKKSHQMGVPVIDMDGVIVVGFDRPKIDAVIRDKKLDNG